MSFENPSDSSDTHAVSREPVTAFFSAFENGASQEEIQQLSHDLYESGHDGRDIDDARRDVENYFLLRSAARHKKLLVRTVARAMLWVRGDSDDYLASLKLEKSRKQTGK